MVRAASQPTSRCKRAQQSPADPEPAPCNTIPRRNLTGKNGSPSTRRNACSKSDPSVTKRLPKTISIKGQTFPVVGIEASRPPRPQSGNAAASKFAGAFTGCLVATDTTTLELAKVRIGWNIERHISAPHGWRRPARGNQRTRRPVPRRLHALQQHAPELRGPVQVAGARESTIRVVHHINAFRASMRACGVGSISRSDILCHRAVRSMQ